jgi:hypothetical protein
MIGLYDKIVCSTNKRKPTYFSGFYSYMPNLSPIQKKQLTDITKEHYQNYLALHLKIKALDSELPNDDYFIGTGLELEEDLPEERLKNQFILAINQLRDFLTRISSLTAPDKNKLYSLTKNNMYDFCVNPNQQEIPNFDKQFRLALDKLFPPEALAVAPVEISKKTSQHLSIFNTENPIQRDEVDSKIEAWAPRYV